MDKEYNVDDILLEIKRRKSREKSGAVPSSEGSVSPSSPQAQAEEMPQPAVHVVRSEGQPAQPVVRQVRPEGQARPAVPQVRVVGQVPPDTAPPQNLEFDSVVPTDQQRANPMEFTGHVRSIQDKAKMRPSKLHPPGAPRPGEGTAPEGRPTAQNQFIFQAVPEPTPPRTQQQRPAPRPPVGFGSFQAGQDSSEDQHTRVLPQFATGQVYATGEFPMPRLGVGDDYQDPEYLEDEYLDDPLPEHSKVDFSEYNSKEDRRDVATDIARVKLWLFVRASLTLLLTIAVFYLSFAGKYVMPLPGFMDPLPETMRGYLLAGTVLSVFIALVNSSAVGGGLISLFRMRANSDSLATLALLAVVAQGVAGVVRPEMVDPARMNLYFPVAATAMLFGALGKMSMINRIQSNFRVVASDTRKKAMIPVESDEFCREFVPEATRKPTIAYSVPSDFFTDFLGLSYSDKYDVGIHRSVAPVCFVASIVVAIVSYLLTENILSAISALAAILCVSATLSATFVENVPLSKLTKKLAPMGGMVSGNKAVEDFCDTKALILTESDLFPQGNIRMRGIKTYSQSRIDDAILDAASVMCAMDGALSPVFLQMVGGNRKMLRKVDNIVFENGMGVSAWVDSRRVLIGNRKLMQNHGIALPPGQPQSSVGTSPEDGELLYLSNSGDASAQFAVSYHIDEELAAQLDQLAARDIHIIVHTCDANITAHRLWELYGYPEDLITILPAERHAEYQEMAAPQKTAIAEVVYTGRAPTMVAAVLACINARTSILYATVIQLVQIVLGYGLVAFMGFMGAIGSLTILQLCIYQVFWFAAIYIVQKAKQS